MSMWERDRQKSAMNQEEAEAIKESLREDNRELASFEGKTIKSIVKTGIDGRDDMPFVEIECTDGSKLNLEAFYGNYTGASEGEYPLNLLIFAKPTNKNSQDSNR